MIRKTSYLLMGATLGVGLLAGVYHSGVLARSSEQDANIATYRQLNLFGDVFERIRSDYVEKPDDTQLIEAAINGMLTSLDPHSSYMSAKTFRDMQVQTRGKFGGLGIEVTMENGLVKVVSPIDDTPAAKAGILANDVITHLDDEPVQGLTLQQAVDRMRGDVGTKIKLKIARPGKDETLEISITRAEIQIRAVRHRQDEEDVGYIRITQFNEQTTDGVRAALESFEKSMGAKMKGIIIDMRNNPGGLLDQAIGVSDVFMERGRIVSTRGRNAEEMQVYNATRWGDLAKGKPVIVLVNGGSASASEIVAGALQDHKRATVIGTRSFGKGSVQTIVPLGGNGAIRLTTARYYTPSGRSIQAKGIDPDIIVQQEVPAAIKGKDETKGESALKGHLRGDAGDEKGGSSAYVPPEAKDDKQLNAALDLLRGKQQNPAYPANPKKAVQN